MSAVRWALSKEAIKSWCLKIRNRLRGKSSRIRLWWARKISIRGIWINLGDWVTILVPARIRKAHQRRKNLATNSTSNRSSASAPTILLLLAWQRSRSKTSRTHHKPTNTILPTKKRASKKLHLNRILPIIEGSGWIAEKGRSRRHPRKITWINSWVRQ